MNPPSQDLAHLLRSMDPVLNPGEYVFATVEPGMALPMQEIVATMREAEGLSVVMPASVAEGLGLAGVFPCAWITLRVHSDLAAVGLTAAFAAALAEAAIPCNVVAGRHHDHLFVPARQVERAMQCLRALQQHAALG